MKTDITELTQRELYAKVEKQAHSLRGNPFEYMVITGMCPVNVVELHAKKIQSLLTDQIGYKEEIAALRQRIAELEAAEKQSLTLLNAHMKNQQAQLAFSSKESDMTTLTDKELIKEIKERIGSLDVRDNIERRAYEIALASLEADPVAYIFKHPAGKLFWALTDESNKEQADVIPVYAAPPVPVVPAALPENDDDDGHDIDYLEPSEVYSLGRTAGWNACRAAMLQGAEPVTDNANQQFESLSRGDK